MMLTSSLGHDVDRALRFGIFFVLFFLFKQKSKPLYFSVEHMYKSPGFFLNFLLLSRPKTGHKKVIFLRVDVISGT